MYLLGIAAHFHDSAAVLIRDGRVVMALEEERFSRVKHENAFPYRAIKRLMMDANITSNDLAAVAYYERPLRRFERILDTFVSTYPFSVQPFTRTMPEWLGAKITVEQSIRAATGFQGAIHYIPHHRSHAAAAFYPSPFQQAAILTIDGVGEYETTGLWMGTGNDIEHLASIHFPHSLGLLYSTVTTFLGFRANHDEAKVMGLAASGKPSFLSAFADILEASEDGSFRLNMDYFVFNRSDQMWSNRFEDIFGKPRLPHSEITDRDRDLAASIQHLMEQNMMNILQELYRRTQIDTVCIGGGVALNATANGKIWEQTPFKHAYVFGASGDNGAALGAALTTYHATATTTQRSPISSLALGTKIETASIRSELMQRNITFEECTSNELIAYAATSLANREVVGWVQDEMEFGPRALGNRSILADPRDVRMKARLNSLKQREDFHPFACSILEEKASDYFDLPDDTSFPFMTFCFPVRKEKIDIIPAVIHTDRTSRLQTVSKEAGVYRELIEAFENKTGVPCLLNTSFNKKNEPIVETATQTIDCFLSLPIDALALGPFWITKNK